MRRSGPLGVVAAHERSRGQRRWFDVYRLAPSCVERVACCDPDQVEHTVTRWAGL